MTIKQTALTFALVLLVLDLSRPGPLFSQGTDTPPPPPDAAQATAVPQLPPPNGGCDSAGVSVSRPWIGRNGQIEWWAWGFAYGTSVGLQVMDAGGRTYAAGSMVVDTICEAGGVLSAGNRPAGPYTLIVSGTRPGGVAMDVMTSFRLVSMPTSSTPGGVIPAVPSPTPGPPPPCQATTAILCP